MKPTAKQLAYLEHLGFNDKPKTKEEASQWINSAHNLEDFESLQQSHIIKKSKTWLEERIVKHPDLYPPHKYLVRGMIGWQEMIKSQIDSLKMQIANSNDSDEKKYLDEKVATLSDSLMEDNLKEDFVEWQKWKHTKIREIKEKLKKSTDEEEHDYLLQEIEFLKEEIADKKAEIADEAKEKREIERERIRDLAQSVFDNFKHEIRKPTLKQIGICIEELDKRNCNWSEEYPIELLNCLTNRFPDIVKLKPQLPIITKIAQANPKEIIFDKNIKFKNLEKNKDYIIKHQKSHKILIVFILTIFIICVLAYVIPLIQKLVE